MISKTESKRIEIWTTCANFPTNKNITVDQVDLYLMSYNVL